MSGESAMRKRVTKILSSLDAQSVENRVGPGMPDVCYIGGWLELKKTKAFPKRAETPVILDHELLTTQKVWMKRHIRKGGKVHVLLQVANEFFLIRGIWAQKFLGEVDRVILTEQADRHYVGWADLKDRLEADLR